MHDIGDASVFVEVARQGSMSKAARQLGLAVSIVSDRVARLERRLGVVLLERTTRRQVLTEAGALYFDRSVNILAEIAEVEAAVRGQGASPRGLLRVTSPTPVGRRRVVSFVAAFRLRYPEINIHLTLEERFADILAEGFDVAIRGGDVADPSLAARKLFEAQRVIVASPAYLESWGAPRHPADLARHACLVFNSGRQMEADWRFGRAAAAMQVRVSGLLASNNSEVPITWSLAGFGLAQKYWWEVFHYVRRGQLVTVLDKFAPDPTPFYAVHPVSGIRSRKIAMFVEELANDLKRRPLDVR